MLSSPLLHLQIFSKLPPYLPPLSTLFVLRQHSRLLSYALYVLLSTARSLRRLLPVQPIWQDRRPLRRLWLLGWLFASKLLLEHQDSQGAAQLSCIPVMLTCTLRQLLLSLHRMARSALRRPNCPAQQEETSQVAGSDFSRTP